MDFNPTADSSSFIFSPTENYFFEQALRRRGGTGFGMIVHGAGRRDLGGMLRLSSDPIREDILREAEKEWIREDAIAAEMRRRELEAEVRREMAMERLSSYSLPSIWSNPRVSRTGVRVDGGAVDRLPFQRSPVLRAATEEQPKNQMTTPNLSGTKRKAVARSSKVSSSGEQGQHEWRCVLCEISTTCQEGLDEHYRGKKHIRKLAQIGKVAKDERIEKTGESQVEKKHKGVNLKQNSGKNWCQLCQVGWDSSKMMKYHLQGKTHQAQLKRLNKKGETTSDTTKNATPGDEMNSANGELKEEVTEAADENGEDADDGFDQNGVESADTVEATPDTVTEEVEGEAEQVIPAVTFETKKEAKLVMPPVEGLPQMKAN